MPSLSQQRVDAQNELEVLVMELFRKSPARRKQLLVGVTRSLALRLTTSEMLSYIEILRRDNA